METSRSVEFERTNGEPLPRELLVFGWNLRSVTTPFEQKSLALNAIERGRAWHWRLLPPGWADADFIFRHGQLKTKAAFATFFPSVKRTEIRPRNPRQRMNVRKSEAPLAWETVKAVFAENPKLKKAGVLAGAHALLHEHLRNEFGRFSFDIDLQTWKEVQQVHAMFTAKDRRRIHLLSRANPELYVYEVGGKSGPVKLEIAKPYLPPKRAPVPSKSIPGLRVVHFADLLESKISALSTRGFVRDLIDLYTAHLQERLDWRRLFLEASNNPLNDYNPVELDHNLKLIEQEFRQGAQAIPCSNPPPISDLKSFLDELSAANAEVARELTQLEGGPENDAIQ